jgi:curved DNA-binding protein CbpA
MEGEERAAAEERFKRVQNAYEVQFCTLDTLDILETRH